MFFLYFLLGLGAALIFTYQEITQPDLTRSTDYYSSRKGEAALDGVIPIALVLFFIWPVAMPLVQVVKFARKKREQIREREDA